MEDLERIYQLISKEEKKVLENLENIDKELQELGTEQKSIVIKTIKGKKYYYEQWRENGVIKYRSFGRVYPVRSARQKSRFPEEKNFWIYKKNKGCLASSCLQRRT